MRVFDEDIDPGRVANASISRRCVWLPYLGVLGACEDPVIQFDVRPTCSEIQLSCTVDGKPVLVPVESTVFEVMSLMDRFFEADQKKSGMELFSFNTRRCLFQEWKQMVYFPERVQRELSRIIASTSAPVGKTWEPVRKERRAG